MSDSDNLRSSLRKEMLCDDWQLGWTFLLFMSRLVFSECTSSLSSVSHRCLYSLFLRCTGFRTDWRLPKVHECWLFRSTNADFNRVQNLDFYSSHGTAQSSQYNWHCGASQTSSHYYENINYIFLCLGGLFSGIMANRHESHCVRLSHHFSNTSQKHIVLRV